MMTPGLALFYGGLVRNKNVLSTIMHSICCLGLISLIWLIYGYSLAFSPDVGGFIGNLDWTGLNGVGLEPGPYADTIPDLLFCGFQLMFAIITPALISGAYAERMKFTAFLSFTVLWSTFVYMPICHWVWGQGGWLGELGAGILWFGWFGFNAGSALSAAAIIGIAAGALCYSAILLKGRLGYDDALDVVAVHGVGGLWGALATGLFASLDWNPDGANGLFFGNPTQFVIQAVGAGTAIVYSLAISFVILKFVDMTIGLRVERDDEIQGLDITQHSEIGYNI